MPLTFVQSAEFFFPFFLQRKKTERVTWLNQSEICGLFRSTDVYLFPSFPYVPSTWICAVFHSFPRSSMKSLTNILESYMIWPDWLYLYITQHLFITICCASCLPLHPLLQKQLPFFIPASPDLFNVGDEHKMQLKLDAFFSLFGISQHYLFTSLRNVGLCCQIFHFDHVDIFKYIFVTTFQRWES